MTTTPTLARNLRHILGILFCLAGLMGGWAARAAPQTYTFTGTIDSFSAGAFGGIELGDSFSGSFVYDPAGTAMGPGVYDAISHMEASVHGLSLTTSTMPGARDIVLTNAATDSLVINTYPGFYGDSLAHNSGSTFTCFGTTCMPYFQYLELADNTGTAFSSQALPATIGLAMFSGTRFYFNWLTSSGLSQVYASGPLTSLTNVSAVPEPGTAALALLGLLPLVGRAALRHRGGWHAGHQDTRRATPSATSP